LYVLSAPNLIPPAWGAYSAPKTIYSCHKVRKGAEGREGLVLGRVRREKRIGINEGYRGWKVHGGIALPFDPIKL